MRRGGIDAQWRRPRSSSFAASLLTQRHGLRTALSQQYAHRQYFQQRECAAAAQPQRARRTSTVARSAPPQRRARNHSRSAPLDTQTIWPTRRRTMRMQSPIGAPPTYAKKEAVPPPQPMEQDDDDEDLYGNETQEQSDAKFMAAFLRTTASGAGQAGRMPTLQAKEGDAEYEKMLAAVAAEWWIRGALARRSSRCAASHGRAHGDGDGLATTETSACPWHARNTRCDTCKEGRSVSLPDGRLPHTTSSRERSNKRGWIPGRRVARRPEVRPRPLASRKWPTTLMKMLREVHHLFPDEDRAGPAALGTPSGSLRTGGSRSSPLTALSRVRGHCNFRHR